MNNTVSINYLTSKLPFIDNDDNDNNNDNNKDNDNDNDNDSGNCNDSDNDIENNLKMITHTLYLKRMNHHSVY